MIIDESQTTDANFEPITASPAESLYYRIQNCADELTLKELTMLIPRIAGYDTPEEHELIRLVAAKQIELGYLLQERRN